MTSAWKHTERSVARLVDGKRNGNTGSNSADVETATLAVEVKHRASLPAWLLDAVQQAQRNADGKTPIVVLHRAGQRHTGDLVVATMSDFLALTGIDAGQDATDQSPSRRRQNLRRPPLRKREGVNNESRVLENSGDT